MRFCLLLFAALVAQGPLQAQETWVPREQLPPPPPSPEVTQRAADAFAKQARAATASSLKDPASAQFRNLFVSFARSEQEGGAIKGMWLCGEVNGRNSYGGYVGFQRFIANEAGAVIQPASEAAGSFDTVVWKRHCLTPVRQIR